MKKILFACFACLLISASWAQPKNKTENVFLITLDGMRWQEVFGGANRSLLRSFTPDSTQAVKTWWADSPEARRQKLMPFIWNEVAKGGQLYGNRPAGSMANVTNQMWFSYPGYNELLSGFADDVNIKSNDKFYNPNKTFLEFLQQKPAFKNRIVAFTSWDVFPYIINDKRSGIPVNAGLMKKSNGNEVEKALNDLMFRVPNPLGDVRLDAFTFQFAFEEIKRSKPRVVYLSFDETDDFAHQGKYDQYLSSAKATDEMIRSLWNWCQLQPAYRNKTTFIITCDHGRGDQSLEAWRHHGRDVEHADQIWMAVIGPDTASMGEVKNGQVYQAQIAATICALLGQEYVTANKHGEVINGVIKKP